MANRPKTTTPLLGQNQNRKSYDHPTKTPEKPHQKTAAYSRITKTQEQEKKLEGYLQQQHTKGSNTTTLSDLSTDHLTIHIKDNDRPFYCSK
jgi:hypothetical protein